jgi:transposase
MSLSKPRAKKPRKKKKKAIRYTPKIALRVYSLLLDGLNAHQIAEMVGITYTTLKRWRLEYGLLRFAYREAAKRTEKGGKHSIIEYIYGRLSKKNKKIWNKIEDLGDKDDKGYDRIRRYFDRKADAETQKMLFLHALTENHFNPSEACKKICIPYAWVKGWIKDDYDFAMLVDEIEFHKKRMGEASLLKLVKQGDVAATIFFNKTKNRDLGYGDELKVKHEGSVDHNVRGTIELGEELMGLLSKGTRRELLGALTQLDKQQEAAVLEDNKGRPIMALPAPNGKGPKNGKSG